ncbi:MAG: hypothetical protein ACO3JG_11355 [Luteolibacter sp.]
MKRAYPKDDDTRFSGGTRHYHRSGAPVTRSWEEWVGGTGKKPGGWLRLLKILGALLAIVALGAIVAGLIIELR